VSIPYITNEEFIIDPQLYAFTEASMAQRAAIRVSFDGLPPANAEQRDFIETALGRPWGEDLRRVRRMVAWVCGADSGKSVIAGGSLLHGALFCSLKGLRPGQRAHGLLMAPDTRLASIPLSYIRGAISASPIIAAEVESETTDSIRFTRGTEIGVLPATVGGRAPRGRRFYRVVMEETAFFMDADYRVNDRDVLRGFRVRVLPDGQIVLISTPWRKTGLLYDLHKLEFGRSERTLVLQAPTALMRPDKSAAALADEFADDPVMAAAELGAEFMENAGAFLEAADLEKVIESRVTRREPEAGFRYVAATDPSGLRNDPWAFTVLGRREDQLAQFVVRSWRPGSSVDQVVTDIASELRLFGLTGLVADQFGSEVTKAHFTRAGIHLEERPFTSGPGSPKTLGFKALREVVIGRRIALLDDVEQSRELKLLEVTRLAGGGERIAAPGRLHDDRACALALAVHELYGGRGADAYLAMLARQLERLHAMERGELPPPGQEKREAIRVVPLTSPDKVRQPTEHQRVIFAAAGAVRRA